MELGATAVLMNTGIAAAKDPVRMAIAMRDAVNAEIERLRQQKVVGTSLEARVTLRCRGTTAELLAACESLLPTLFIS